MSVEYPFQNCGYIHRRHSFRQVWFKSAVDCMRTEKTEKCGPILRLGDETVTASDHVRLLGVTISSDLSRVKHVGTISSSCFYWLRQIRRIYFDDHLTLSLRGLVHAFITSRIDDCNTVLAGRQEPSLTGYNVC